MAFVDKWLRCVECGREFLWDAGEQAWYWGKSFQNQPKRCKHCRDKRRVKRGNHGWPDYYTNAPA